MILAALAGIFQSFLAKLRKTRATTNGVPMQQRFSAGIEAEN
jgi:hypothetical protein